MSANILLVEDDPNLGTLLEEYLKLKGNYVVTLCTDGEEAVKAFHSQSFDLCILDVMMPKKDGFAVGREIRKTNSTNPIIFATAKSMMEEKTEDFTLGGADYITKPFSINELRSEEHTSELQSLMRISYAVFCLKKKHENTDKPLNIY